MAIDPLQDCPGYAMRRASAAAMAELAKRLAAVKLTPTEATVLLVIEANRNIMQSEIGRMLEMASANVTPLVSRLEDRELLEREPFDGRSHGLNLTTAGRALTGRVKKIINAHEDALLAKVPAAHRNAFLTALQALWGGDAN
jgi:DNA-binding MarR family transcriptional regulator